MTEHRLVLTLNISQSATLCDLLKGGLLQTVAESLATALDQLTSVPLRQGSLTATPNVEIQRRKASKFDLDQVPGMTLDLDTEKAYENGYKHGYQNKVTKNICIFPRGDRRYYWWQRGYEDGEQDYQTWEGPSIDDGKRPCELCGKQDNLRHGMCWHCSRPR